MWSEFPARFCGSSLDDRLISAMKKYGCTNPESMSADWDIPPAAVAWPGRTAGLSAAVFAGGAARNLEVSSSSDPTTHILAVSTLSHHAIFAVDGREVHEGKFETGAIQLVQASEAPAAMLTGDWRVIHIYLPAGDLRQLAEDLGLSALDARALSFAIPYFHREPVLGRIGRRLDQRLSRGDMPSRIELDDLFLRVGCRLIRTHATIKPPRRSRPPELSGPERRRVLALLSDARDAGLDDLAHELDRSWAESDLAFRETFHAAPHEIRGSLRRGRWR